MWKSRQWKTYTMGVGFLNIIIIDVYSLLNTKSVAIPSGIVYYSYDLATFGAVGCMEGIHSWIDILVVCQYCKRVDITKLSYFYWEWCYYSLWLFAWCQS